MEAPTTSSLTAVPAPPPDTPESRPFYSPELLIARHAAQRRRAAAMVSTYDVIMGLRFSPLTPATYSRLVLIDSPFLWKARPEAFPHAAVRDYLWNHWAEFDESGAGRNAFLRQLTFAISPPWRRLFHSGHAWAQRPAAAYAVASEAICELMSIAFADAPASRNDGSIVCASLEAQMIDLFAERYQWSPERTRATPIRQLFQFLRCNDRTDYAPEDADIIAEDLRLENEAAAAARASA